MRILPFRRSAASEPAPVARDWSQQELADFYRAHRLLVQNGVQIGMDRGVSDVGEPWMVFFDTATQDVFLHIARIDNRCVLICETLRIKLTRSTIHDIITDFEAEVRQVITLREERNSNVLLHPAARIIMSISAVFLLFKLENSQAHAKGVVIDPATIDTTRKQDLSVSGRMHQVLGRLLDMADTPAAAAALAGAILTLEFSRSQASEHGSGDTVLAAPELPQDIGSPVVEVSQDTAALTVDPLQAPINGPATEAVQVVALDLDAKVQIAVNVKAVPAAPAAAAVRMAAADSSAEQPPERAEAAEPHPAERPAASGGSGNVSTTQPSSAPASTETAAQSGGATVEVASLAATTVKPLVLAADEPTKLPASSTATTTLFPVSDKVLLDKDASVSLAVVKGIGEITVGNLDLLNADVGLFRETSLNGDTLTSTLVALMSNFGSYEVEISGGRVLIEQHDAALMNSHDIGIWTNVMDDGSAISVVGSLALVGDLTGALA